MKLDWSAKVTIINAAVVIFFLADHWYGFLPQKAVATPNWTYLYYSETKGELSIGIRPDGTAELGKNYDRETEALKLLQMAKQLQTEGRLPDCFVTNYDTIPNGERRIYPGEANPPAPWVFQQSGLR